VNSERRDEPRVLRSSGNASLDLDTSKPAEKKTKVQLATAINRMVQERKLTQDEAARLLQITQPKVSALANYRLGGFSVERLMNFLTALGRDVEIIIRQPRSRRAPKIHVTAA
jgi:predicted XRE-type DNA-binding protein